MPDSELVPFRVAFDPAAIDELRARLRNTRFTGTGASSARLSWWNEPAKGGHFAAFEQPELFVDEVRASFRPLR